MLLELNQIPKILTSLFDFRNSPSSVSISRTEFSADSDGINVVADVDNGSLDFIDGVTGGIVPLSTNFSYPNGVEVDEDSNVYVADQTQNKIVRINAYDTTDFEVISTAITGPNGVVLSPDGQTLYVMIQPGTDNGELDASRDIAETLSRSQNIMYLPGGNMLLNVNASGQR